MRKIFTTLKSVVAATIIGAMTLAVSCSYDDSAITERVDKVEKDVASLTERVAALEKRLGEEVEALTALINGKVVVTSVEKDGDATKVTLSDGSTFTVYPECTVVDTDTDTDTNTYISIAEDNGVLYFAVYEMGQFKEWLLINGEKVPVYDGNDQDDDVCDNPYQPEAPIAPQFKVEGENILVSIDGGQTWVESGLSAAAAGAQIFTGVEVNDNNTVTFTLANGSTFDVVIAELIEFNTTRGQLYVKPGETTEITVTINDSVADVNVMNQPLGWKAAIAPVSANEGTEGDDVDPGMGVLAAGGTEFALQITAPSKDFIDAGYAETNGYISVHFNSDNGACKVGKIVVEVAAIALDVDKNGVITVTNTWVDTYTQREYGEEYAVTEFNNYYLAIMPLDYYNEDLTQIYNPNWWAFTVPNVGAWIHNFFANVNPEFNTYDKIQYVEGENEKWVFQASIEDILKQIDYERVLTYEGESFAVVVVPTDPSNQGRLMLDKAVAATFRQLNVNVEVVNTTWNDAFFSAKLRGAEAYHFNIKNKADLQSEIANGWYDSEDAYYEDYLMMWTMGDRFGSHVVTTDMSSEYISFNDLLNYTALEGDEYIYPLAPNTTYYFAILVEQEGKTEYTLDDIIRFEFTTADLVEAELAVEVALNEEKTTYFEIVADVTVPENTAAVYALWTDEELLENIKDTVIAETYPIDDFEEGYSFTVETGTNSESATKYLAMVVIAEDGTYTLVQREYKSKAVVVKEGVTLTIENVEFLTEGGIAKVTLGGVEGQEVASYRAYACTKGAMSFYAMDEEEIATLAYSNDYRINDYTTNPFTIAKTSDYKSAATVGTTYVIAAAVVFADGSVSNVVCEEREFAEVQEPVGGDVVALSAAARYDSNNSYATIVDFTLPNNDIASVAFRTGDGGWDLDLCFTKGFNYINAGQWTSYADKGSSTVWYGNAYLNGEYATIDGIIAVSYIDDAYGFTFKINNYNVTYTGAVEGLVAPQVTGDGLPKEEEVVDRTNITFVYSEEGGASVFGSYSTVSLIGNDGKNYIRLEFNSSSGTPEDGVTYTFDPEDNSYASGTLSGNGVWIGYNGFVDSSYYSDAIPQSGTVAVTVADDVYTFVLDFTLPDGSKFSGTFEGAIPFK